MFNVMLSKLYITALTSGHFIVCAALKSNRFYYLMGSNSCLEKKQLKKKD